MLILIVNDCIETELFCNSWNNISGLNQAQIWNFLRADIILYLYVIVGSYLGHYLAMIHFSDIQ